MAQPREPEPRRPQGPIVDGKGLLISAILGAVSGAGVALINYYYFSHGHGDFAAEAIRDVSLGASAYMLAYSLATLPRPRR